MSKHFQEIFCLWTLLWFPEDVVFLAVIIRNLNNLQQEQQDGLDETQFLMKWNERLLTRDVLARQHALKKNLKNIHEEPK